MKNQKKIKKEIACGILEMFDCCESLEPQKLLLEDGKTEIEIHPWTCEDESWIVENADDIILFYEKTTKKKVLK